MQCERTVDTWQSRNRAKLKFSLQIVSSADIVLITTEDASLQLSPPVVVIIAAAVAWLPTAEDSESITAENSALIAV